MYKNAYPCALLTAKATVFRLFLPSGTPVRTCLSLPHARFRNYGAEIVSAYPRIIYVRNLQQGK